MSMGRPLKDFPQLLTSGSSKMPHIIQSLDHVLPQLTMLDSEKKEFIPLFIAAQINKEGTLTTLNPKKRPETRFCLIFYPSPDEPPIENVDSRLVEIVKEYWSTIQPMIICRDTSGYYLGSPQDSNIVLFEICAENQGECWICQIQSKFNESICYTTQTPIFSSERIYLRKANSPEIKTSAE